MGGNGGVLQSLGTLQWGWTHSTLRVLNSQGCLDLAKTSPLEVLENAKGKYCPVSVFLGCPWAAAAGDRMLGWPGGTVTPSEHLSLAGLGKLLDSEVFSNRNDSGILILSYKTGPAPA